ncbi:DinB family protein [Mucilaginibacter panaciglaebae]|uniref:DinB family protein n=1 Tax=Mucilaginibacter panaciglaebae TaxID=502331 RepID=A0ABP7X2B5_9SPHI
MKEYFLRMFGYDLYANNQILATMRRAKTPQNTLVLMAHLLGAQMRWLKRCKNQSEAGLEMFPQVETIPFETLIAQNHREWSDFLNELADTDMDRAIVYRNTSGAEFSSTITEIATQVINHGTHHRAQIGQLLKQIGVDALPPLDFIFYIRQ